MQFSTKSSFPDPRLSPTGDTVIHAWYALHFKRRKGAQNEKKGGKECQRCAFINDGGVRPLVGFDLS